MLHDRQLALLADERARTGLSLAELTRRALDKTYRSKTIFTVRGFELSIGLWRRPDAAVAGRRVKTET